MKMQTPGSVKDGRYGVKGSQQDRRLSRNIAHAETVPGTEFGEKPEPRGQAGTLIKRFISMIY
jgi:hypothetical protein